jgi:hypothetical protein
MEIDMEEQYVSRFIKITNEMKARIIELWQQNKTGSEIGEELGITRNSVIGAVYRMRRQGHILSSHEENKKNFNRKEKKAEAKQKVFRKKKQILLDAKKISKENITMSELKYYSCRYIVKEGNYETTKYCGKKADRCSYCEEHYKLCYYPARTKLEKLLRS